jgi:hypothetical protein
MGTSQTRKKLQATMPGKDKGPGHTFMQVTYNFLPVRMYIEVSHGGALYNHSTLEAEAGGSGV